MPRAPALACSLGPPGTPGGDAYRFRITGPPPFPGATPGMDLSLIARGRRNEDPSPWTPALCCSWPQHALAGRAAQARFIDWRTMPTPRLRPPAVGWRSPRGSLLSDRRLQPKLRRHLIADAGQKKSRTSRLFCLSGPGFPGPLWSLSGDQMKTKSLVVRLPPCAARPRMPISCTASVKSVPPPAKTAGIPTVRSSMVNEKSAPFAANSTW